MKRLISLGFLLLSVSISAQQNNEQAQAPDTSASTTQTSESTPIDAALPAQDARQAQTTSSPPSPLPARTATQIAPRAGSSEVVNLSATIVGNQEQPTVLYIVPWKAAEDTTILYLPLSSKAMEEIFGHVERVEHQRQVQFIDQLDKN